MAMRDTSGGRGDVKLWQNGCRSGRLGNIDVLFCDNTGTLTVGEIFKQTTITRTLPRTAGRG